MPEASAPSDDDYIPFGQPVTNGAFPGQQGENLSGYIGRPPPPPPPPPPLEDSYEPAVEIIVPPDPEPTQLSPPLVDSYEPAAETTVPPDPEPTQLSEDREAEIRRKVEEQWDKEQSKAYRSMRETGLPIISRRSGIPLELAVIEEGVFQELKTEDSTYRAQYGAHAKPDALRKPGGARWRLPRVKKHASPEDLDGYLDEWRGESNRTRTRGDGGRYSGGKIKTESEMLSHLEERFLPEIEKEEELKLPPISEFAIGQSPEEEEGWEERDGDEATRASEGSELWAAEKSKGKKFGARKARESRDAKEARGKKPRARKAGESREFEGPSEEDVGELWGAEEPREKKPRARKAREPREARGPGEEGEPGPRHTRKSESLDGWEPKRTETSDDAWQEKGPESLREKRRRKKWELPPTEEVERVFKRAVPAPQSKLEHYIANTPRGQIENWKIQKAALLRKFGGEAWNPRKKISPTAQDWIRDIHARAPEFTTEKLSDLFEISPDAIRRILKSSWRPTPEEAQEREKRWSGRRERIWDKWMDEGLVQTKGMRREVRQVKEEARKEWKEREEEKKDKYLEKIEARKMESENLLQRARGAWMPDDEHFTSAGGSRRLEDALEQDYGNRPLREYRGRPRPGDTETPRRDSGTRQQGNRHFIPGGPQESGPPQDVPEKDHGSRPRKEYQGYQRRIRPQQKDIETPQRSSGAQQPGDRRPTPGNTPEPGQSWDVSEDRGGRREYGGYHRRSKPRSEETEMPQRATVERQPDYGRFAPGHIPGSRPPTDARMPERNYVNMSSRFL